MIKSKKFRTILNKVPEDYYASGVKNDLFQRLWHTNKWNSLRQMLAGASGKLLDVGCADGTTTREIKKYFPNLEITGVDIYPRAIKYAKKNSRDINFITADAHSLPFGKASYGWVCTVEVLEHLHDSGKVLDEIHRVLKKRGYLLVVQDTDSLLFKIVWWFWTKGKGSVWTGSHINCMVPVKLISSIKKKGFRIERVKLINFGMEILILAQKI